MTSQMRKRVRSIFWFVFPPRSVVSQQTQYSLCFCLRRLVLQPGLKNQAVRPSSSLRCTYLIPIEKTSHNTSRVQSDPFLFSGFLVAINGWNRTRTPFTVCQSSLLTCQTCVELMCFNDNTSFLFKSLLQINS